MGISGRVVCCASLPASVLGHSSSTALLTKRKGGVTNGQDMVAAYIRSKWPGPTAETALAIADVGDRSQEYGSTK